MDAAGLNYIKKPITLAAGATFDVSSLKSAGMLILSEGARTAVFAFAETYSNQVSIETLYADVEGEFITTAGTSHTIHFGRINGKFLITNNYPATRTIVLSIF